jgi:hypothetical protein
MVRPDLQHGAVGQKTRRSNSGIFQALQSECVSSHFGVWFGLVRHHTHTNLSFCQHLYPWLLTEITCCRYWDCTAAIMQQCVGIIFVFNPDEEGQEKELIKW